MLSKKQTNKKTKNFSEMKVVWSKGCLPGQPKTMMEKRPTPTYIIINFKTQGIERKS